MSTDYPGAATGAQSPSPAPLPGGVPTVRLPTVSDGFSETAHYQPLKTEADYTAYLQKTARWRPPLTPNGMTGFTAVTLSGSGPGNGVAPLAVSSTQTQKTIGPVAVVVKIMVGGAVGTATFQWSNDGGATFGATTATAATYTDATSGIAVAFSGTLVAADKYSFSPTDNPMGMFVDASGNPRHRIDHMGLAMGGGGRFDEGWPYFLNQTGAASASVFGGRWIAYTTGGGGNAVQILPPAAGYGNQYVLLLPGTVNANVAKIVSGASTGMFSPLTTGLTLAMEFDIALSAIGANTLTAWWGLSSTATPESGSTDLLGFYWASGGFSNGVTSGNLGFRYGPSSLMQTAILNFQPAASSVPNIRCRLEYYGSASPLGQGARAFINGNLVAVVTGAGNLPAAQLFPFFGGVASGTVGAAAYVGNVRAAWNVWPTPEAL